jgi:hypothetical protein
MSEITSQIALILEKLTKLEVAQKHGATLKESLVGMRNELQNLYAVEAKELEDIENLEKLNITSLFKKVLGTKEEQLEKERQEYLAVNLKIKELNKSIELSEYELGLVEKKIKEADQLKNELEALKQRRQKEIIASNSIERDSLIKLHNTHDQLLLRNNEIKEAHDTGRLALEAIESVHKYLSEAIKNSEWDILSSGRQYDYHKHRSLDFAADHCYRAQQLLNHFNKELLDVGIYEQALQINLNQISKFTDTFFDNLISDWIIHNKIKNSYHVVESLIDKVRLILNTLELEFKQINVKVDKVKSDINDILLKV